MKEREEGVASCFMLLSRTIQCRFLQFDWVHRPVGLTFSPSLSLSLLPINSIPFCILFSGGKNLQLNSGKEGELMNINQNKKKIYAVYMCYCMCMTPNQRNHYKHPFALRKKFI